MQRPGLKRHLFTTYCSSRADRDLLSREMIFIVLFKDLMLWPSRRLPWSLHPSHKYRELLIVSAVCELFISQNTFGDAGCVRAKGTWFILYRWVQLFALVRHAAPCTNYCWHRQHESPSEGKGFKPLGWNCRACPEFHKLCIKNEIFNYVVFS